MPKKKKRTRALLGPIIAALLVLTILSVAAAAMASGTGSQSKQAIEDAVRKAAAAYYAAEGVYPPGLGVIKEKYALQIDEARYEIKYDIFAENLAPDVTVVERPNKKGGGSH